jgi:hypothetical protein
MAVPFNKFNIFIENLAEKVHNLGSDALKVALTNTAPVASNQVLADITEISYTYLSSRALTVASSSQASGLYKLIINDLVLTATGGTVGPFRYIVIYNDTPTSPADPLIGWYDNGSSISILDGQQETLDFDGTAGCIQLQ